MSFSNVGRVWTRQSFANYLSTLKRPAWIEGITMHHTGAPSLATRPRGLTSQHIENIAGYYAKELSWKSGPHLFIDEDQIFGMTPLHERGVHARSFNGTHLGIEVLGEYDSEIPTEGRGLQCWMTAAVAVAELLQWLDLETTAINYHRDDPKTSKTCAGSRVKAEWFRQLVLAMVLGEVVQPEEQTPAQIFSEDFVPAGQWLRSQGRKELPRNTKEGLLLGNHRVERHYYDKVAETTMISLRELQAWLATTAA